MTDTLEDDVVHAYPDGERSASASIVRAVAAALDRAPSEMGPLDAVIDPDALESLFSPQTSGDRQAGAHVTFAYEGCDVTVRANGEFVVRPPGDA